MRDSLLRVRDEETASWITRDARRTRPKFIHELTIKAIVLSFSVLDYARDAENRQDLQTALDKYQQGSDITPDFAYAKFEFGKFYLRRADPIRALTFFQRAYTWDKRSLNAYWEACNLHRRSGNYSR